MLNCEMNQNPPLKSASTGGKTSKVTKGPGRFRGQTADVSDIDGNPIQTSVHAPIV
jgi:hypothetical protein